MSQASERRQFWRANFHSPVRLDTGSGMSFVELQDISLKGALVVVPADWSGHKDDTCRLHLDLGGDVTITLLGTIVHHEGSHVGIRCDRIDLDSITHLRRLVELNAGDAALLDRELHTLLEK